MEILRIGDFIRLKNMEEFKIERFSGRKVNIFEIINIKPEYVEVKNCVAKIPISEIEPILINGGDDTEIYYDPIIAASTIFPGDPLPVHRKDYTYYYEAFKRNSYQNKNFQELIKENNLQYVHEVQHFLFDRFSGDKGLKINAF